MSTLTLDGILGERALGRMLIKIDVEGTEREVLAGATKTLLRSPQPLWFVEINFDDHYPSGSNPYFLETFEVFWKSGYSCHRADDLKETVSPERVKRWLSSGTQDRSGHNYLFVPCKM